MSRASSKALIGRIRLCAEEPHVRPEWITVDHPMVFGLVQPMMRVRTPAAAEDVEHGWTGLRWRAAQLDYLVADGICRELGLGFFALVIQVSEHSDRWWEPDLRELDVLEFDRVRQVPEARIHAPRRRAELDARDLAELEQEEIFG